MRLIGALTLVTATACGANEVIRPLEFADAGSRDGAIELPLVAEPMPPRPPELGELETWAEQPPMVELPELRPCPAGWNELSEGGSAICDPWPLVRAECQDEFAHFTGEPGCRVIGTTCPQGQYADPPIGPVLYVAPSTTAGGDGSLSSPYSAIGDAIAAASAGTTLLLAKGRFVETLVINRDVELLGACVGETVIAGLVTTMPTISVQASQVELRDLHIEGPHTGIAFELAPSGSRLTLEGVLVTDTSETGIKAAGAGLVLEAHDVVVRDNTLIGMTLSRQVTAELSALVLERNVGNALKIQQGAIVHIADAAILDTVPYQGINGSGIYVDSGAQLELERSIVERAVRNAVTVIDARLRLIDSVLRDTQPVMGVGWAVGVWVEGRGAAEIRRTLVERTFEGGIVAVASTATISDVIVRDVRPVAGDVVIGGIGIGVGGAASLSRILLARNQDAGLVIIGSTVVSTHMTIDSSASVGIANQRGSLRLRSALIRQNQLGGMVMFDEGAEAELEDTWFFGNSTVAGRASVAISSGARLVARRLSLDREQHLALVMQNPGTSAELEDLVIRGTRALSELRSGRALVVNDAEVHVRRALLERNQIAALSAIGESRVWMEDAILRDTTSDQFTGYEGFGALVTDQAQLTLERVLVERNQMVGLAIGQNGTLDMSDVVVRDTRSMEGVVAPWSFGLGLLTNERTTVRARRVELLRNRMWGAALLGGHAELEDLVIKETLANELDSRFGGGLVAYQGATATLNRARIEANRFISVLAADLGTTLALTDANIHRTQRADCDVTGGACENKGLGSGVVVVRGAAVALQHFSIGDNALAGIHVASSTTGDSSHDGSIDAAEGEVFRNPIGVDIEIEDYDLERISNRVYYRDNGRDLQSITLPVPSPGELFSTVE